MGRKNKDLWMVGLGLRGAVGGRNEETFSKYAGGIRVERYPSRRQHKQVL